MEEVDKIIIHSLKDIGCAISDEVDCLDHFSTNLIIEAASKCLSLITPGLEVPSTLPMNMAARFQVGADIAGACKKLGYTGEVGYQTFLYSNVIEVRRVFMFLIEKLPREQEKTVVVPDEPLLKIKAEIGKVMKVCLGRRLELKDLTSRPFISKALETGITLPGIKNRLPPKAWREYCIKDLPFITEQSNPISTLASLTTVNARGRCDLELTQKSRDNTPTGLIPPRPAPRLRRFNNTWLGIHEHILFSEESVKSPAQKSASSESSLPKRENNDQLLEEKVEDTEEERKKKDRVELESLRARLEELEMSTKSLNCLLVQTNKEIDAEMNSAEQRSVEIQAHNKAIELLADHQTSLEKLDKITSSVKKKLVALAGQWEEHRRPLMEKYRHTKAAALLRENENEKQLETIYSLKEKLESLNKQIANKQLARDKLQEEYDQLPKNIKRSAYTRRILEIIGNIKKQKDEIDKVIKDMKTLQKDTNLLTEKLERSFTVTDDTIFRNTKKDEHSKKAHKFLMTLHSDCADIVSMVQETGATVREIREMEEQIEVESSRNVGANLKRITADLEQMKEENIVLSNQLKMLDT
ncbi:coiled-coil domain-containing protein 22 homolog [Rhodnius prolixus]|uniref:coiled-coil domain-containing protein 22 homolog n=1 Tax=Rhodnius prolixus TaxID=13249 RepID=UPI003D18DB46